MKKLFITLFLITMCFSIQAQKYLIYTDSVKAHTKIDSITKLIVTPALSHKEIMKYGRVITTSYTTLVWNNTHTQCAVEIDPKYNNLFTIKENQSSVVLDDTWTKKK